jgi:hypothetical protein
VVVARAEAAANDSSFASRSYSEAKNELESLGLPIGWANGWGAPRQDNMQNRRFEVWNHLFGPLFGWLLTALAATMGAPFWFDLLNKVMVIRSTVKPHEKSPEEASEDRQHTPHHQYFSDNIEGKEPPFVGIPTTPPSSEGLLPTPRDEESSLDGCQVVAEKFTLDENLPAAEGGVA